jgi:endonuclease III
MPLAPVRKQGVARRKATQKPAPEVVKTPKAHKTRQRTPAASSALRPKGRPAAKASATARFADDRRRALLIHRRLGAAYPEARCSLDYTSPLELLVATILSAQCTDERVNKVTPELFRRHPTAEHYARATQESIEALIRSTGFFRNKTKSIRGAAIRLVEHFGGKVPETMDELLTLPGVARKTANVVLGNAYDKASGVVVDTHVARITRRLGLTKETHPVKIERDLMALLPSHHWVMWSHRLIHHGRQICIARSPRCASCVVADLCPSAEI